MFIFYAIFCVPIAILVWLTPVRIVKPDDHGMVSSKDRFSIVGLGLVIIGVLVLPIWIVLPSLAAFQAVIRRHNRLERLKRSAT
jgi:hypothetical protein